MSMLKTYMNETIQDYYVRLTTNGQNRKNIGKQIKTKFNPYLYPVYDDPHINYIIPKKSIQICLSTYKLNKANVLYTNTIDSQSNSYNIFDLTHDILNLFYEEKEFCIIQLKNECPCSGIVSLFDNNELKMFIEFINKIGYMVTLPNCVCYLLTCLLFNVKLPPPSLIDVGFRRLKPNKSNICVIYRNRYVNHYHDNLKDALITFLRKSYSFEVPLMCIERIINKNPVGHVETFTGYMYYFKELYKETTDGQGKLVSNRNMYLSSAKIFKESSDTFTNLMLYKFKMNRKLRNANKTSAQWVVNKGIII